MSTLARLAVREEVVAAGAQDVLVAYATLDQPVSVQDRLISTCSPAELGRAARQVRPEAARERLVARGLLRTVLGERLGVRAADVPLERTPDGKPRVAGTLPPVRFSLSHSCGVVALTLHDRLEVGIDVEHRGRRLDLQALTRAVLPPGAAGSTLPDGPGRHDAFLRWWTRQEALGKGGGRGLDWRTSAATGAWLTPAEVRGSWAVRDLDAPAGFVAAVAVAVERLPG